MCDEITETENGVYWERSLFSRREVTVGTGAAMAVMLTGCGPARAPAKEARAEVVPTQPSTTGVSSVAREVNQALSERMVTIPMPEGEAEAFFVAPEAGQHPGVLMWPDVAGLREAYKTMAARLAREGYAVLVVNQYYRSTRLPVLSSFAEWRTNEGREKIRPMREALTAEGVASDGAAFIAWLDQQKEVDKAKKMATSGYCMGGPFTFRTAASAPDRVGVIASFHGGGLVTDEPDSPHRLLSKTKVAALICIAQNDDERDPEAKTRLRTAADEAKVPAEIEVYPAQHGWCTIDSPVYNQDQAERAWARMLATLSRYL